MLRKYVQVDDDNVAVGPVYVYGAVDAPVTVVPHNNPRDIEAGMMWDGTNWVQTQALVRSKRDNLLTSEVDLIAGNFLRWSSLSPEQQAAWSNYRQELLDVPQQSGFPDSVIWPTKPN